jgi:hypothetical protein
MCVNIVIINVGIVSINVGIVIINDMSSLIVRYH